MQPKLKVYKYYLLARKRKKRGLAAVFKTRDPAGEPNSKIQYFKPLCAANDLFHNWASKGGDFSPPAGLFMI